MLVEQIKVGYLSENCYIIYKDNKCLIVDPGDEKEKIEDFILKNNLKILGILITHYHFDHIGCLDYFKDKYNLKVYDFKTIGNVKIEGFEFGVIKTKGHSKESVSFYFEKENLLFVGDFLFRGSIGRMDLEGGSVSDMKESIQKLKNFKTNPIIYPGHGEETTLKEELENNMYILDESLL